MARRSSHLATLLLAVGCTTDGNQSDRVAVDTLAGGVVRTITSAPVDSGRWTLVLEHVVQPDEGQLGELMSPSDLALTEDGILLVSEQKPAEIKVFDASGRYLRSIGHEGDGPGEFRAAWIAARRDTLAVQDPRNSRGTTFVVSTGAMVASRATACCYWYPIGVDGAGRAVARAMMRPDSGAPPFQGFVRFALGASTVDTARIPERPVDASLPQWVVKEGDLIRFSRLVPLRPRDIHAVDRTGGFITGWTGEYVLRTTLDGSDTVALFGRTFTAEAVSPAEKAAIVDRIVRDQLANDTDTPEAVLRKAFIPGAIPDVRPAFDGIWTDPAGRRWIRLSTTDTTKVRMDLFDRDGLWLDQLVIPTSEWTANAYEPVAFGMDRVAVMGEDANGRPHVRVYSIRRRQ